MAELPYADIQGIILRSAKMPFMRQLVLQVLDAAAARGFVGALAEGPGPRVSSAIPWNKDEKPESVLYVSFSFAGLKALGVPEASLSTFPEEFIAGAVERAEEVGDTGDSSPEHWKQGLNTDLAHIFVTIPAMSAALLDRVTQTVLALAAKDGACVEIARFDGNVLPGGDVAHFGYRDGFGQPEIEGGVERALPSPQPKAPSGEFLIGYPSQFVNFSYPVPQPDVLGLNGTFGALRILEQDTAGFEKFLEDNSGVIDKELLAAKICGRWRNGTPLSLSPDTANPIPPIPPEKLNWFDYKPTDEIPDAVDDKRGYRCPIGSHIRRNNPRSADVAGGNGHKHRIVRRGLPYGPPFDPANPNDGQERGLLGLFLCVSLKDQFEFLMSEWVNDGLFAPGLGRSKDAVIGDNSPADSEFKIARPKEEGGSITIRGFSKFVTTRGSAYCFFPSIPALRHIANR
jgi:deferrochelatase/peroxidase EfeB